MDFRLFLVRHGQTTSNRDGFLQGQQDSPLTEQGQDEADTAGERLSRFSWTKKYSSDLGRAHQTALRIESKSVVSNPGLELTALLREICFGPREGLPVGLSMEEAISKVSGKLGIPLSEVVDDSETREHIRARQWEYLTLVYSDLKQQQLDEEGLSTAGTTTTAGGGSAVKKVLAVSHGGFIKLFVTLYCDLQCDKIRNSSVSVLDVSVSETSSGEVSFTVQPVIINSVDEDLSIYL